MNYYYDIILNWNEDNPYEFYEWNDTDYLELVKKIPFLKIKHKLFLEISENKIKVNEEFLSLIFGKTLVSSKKELCKIDYACLITDGKNVIALEFDNSGLCINRSKLLIEDEINALELAYSLRESEISFEIIEKLSIEKQLRQEEEAKKIIKLELNSLYQNKELSKLRYLYYEYTGIKSEDIEEIYESLNKELEGEFKEKFLIIYNIIKLSYHKV